jgi:hypothetical protein
MRWFLDTEFHEDGKTIDLISIALVSEAGVEREWVSSEFDEARCSDWVKANVLPRLPAREQWVPRAQIATEIKELVLARGDKPEFWAYFADYDWVALCQLFGRMVDLPEGFPFWCRDLKQMMAHFGVKKDELPSEEGPEHSALADARWVRKAYLYVQQVTS